MSRCLGRGVAGARPDPDGSSQIQTRSSRPQPGACRRPSPPAGWRPPLPLASLGAPPAAQPHPGPPCCSVPRVGPQGAPTRCCCGECASGAQLPEVSKSAPDGNSGGGRRGAGSERSHDPAAALDLHLPRSAASSPADALPLHGTPQSKGLAAEAPGPPWGRGAWLGGAQQHPPLARDPSLSRLAWNGLPVISLGRFPLRSSRVLEDERSWPEKAPGGLGAACLRGNVPGFPSAPSEGQSRPAQRAWPRSQHPTGLSQWALPSGGPCVPAGMIPCIRGPAATPAATPQPRALWPLREQGAQGLTGHQPARSRYLFTNPEPRPRDSHKFTPSCPPASSPRLSRARQEADSARVSRGWKLAPCRLGHGGTRSPAPRAQQLCGCGGVSCSPRGWAFRGELGGAATCVLAVWGWQQGGPHSVTPAEQACVPGPWRVSVCGAGCFWATAEPKKTHLPAESERRPAAIAGQPRTQLPAPRRGPSPVRARPPSPAALPTISP